MPLYSLPNCCTSSCTCCAPRLVSPITTLSLHTTAPEASCQPQRNTRPQLCAFDWVNSCCLPIPFLLPSLTSLISHALPCTRVSLPCLTPADRVAAAFTGRWPQSNQNSPCPDASFAAMSRGSSTAMSVLWFS